MSGKKEGCPPGYDPSQGTGEQSRRRGKGKRSVLSVLAVSEKGCSSSRRLRPSRAKSGPVVVHSGSS
eukprot:4097724-Prorocentrum_lima.AAC.1